MIFDKNKKEKEKRNHLQRVDLALIHDFQTMETTKSKEIGLCHWFFRENKINQTMKKKLT
jgi:hypothetical protein